MTLCVEKVPVGKNCLVRVSHDHNSPPLESADVLLKKEEENNHNSPPFERANELLFRNGT